MREVIHGLTRDDMSVIAGLVYERSGIRLTEMKTALVSARLQKHVRAHGFSSFDEYVRHVRSDPTGEELAVMVEALTTHKTSFFRESVHFQFLAEEIVPQVLGRGARTISGWSAGCATGEEPYSIATALLEALRGRGPCEIDLLASDISRAAIGTAVRGVYPLEAVQTVPDDMLRRYFERGIGDEDGLARVRSAVRRLVRFQQANLVEPAIVARARDFIFCRNTLMYFDRSARAQAVSHLEASLAPGGYLFVAHAENLTGLGRDLVRVGPAIYQRRPK